MDNNCNQQTDLPEWLVSNENYIPVKDKDTFVDKSILSVFKIISRIKKQDIPSKFGREINASLKVLFVFLLLIEISLSRSFVFVMIVILYLLAMLCAMNTSQLIKILKMSCSFTMFTAIIMLPAFLGGNSYSTIMITSKVFVSITAMGILSHSTKWNLLTEALKRFKIPDLFILILDITIKYIYLLGELSLNMFYSLKLRSVGKNREKHASLAGITGTIFLQSREMAEDMYYAMECRGFSGDYHISHKSKLKWQDYVFITFNIGLFVLFLYLGRILTCWK